MLLDLERLLGDLDLCLGDLERLLGDLDLLLDLDLVLLLDLDLDLLRDRDLSLNLGLPVLDRVLALGSGDPDLDRVLCLPPDSDRLLPLDNADCLPSPERDLRIGLGDDMAQCLLLLLLSIL